MINPSSIEYYHSIVDTQLIYLLPIIVLWLILIELFFKNRFQTNKAFNGIRWLMIGYTIITASFSFSMAVIDPDQYSLLFSPRLDGPYAWAYIFMLVCALLLPFSLLHNKLGSKSYFILLIAILMKSGVHFERFVIILTSFHRDYNTDPIEVLTFPLSTVLHGFAIAALYIFVLELQKKK